MKKIFVLLLGLIMFTGCSALQSVLPSRSGPQSENSGPTEDSDLPGLEEPASGVLPDRVSPVPQGLGLAVWSGLPELSDNVFLRGMDFLFREGFQTFKLVVSPQSHATYRFNSGCETHRDNFLECLVSTGPMEQILGHPRLQIANLVVFDPVTAGPSGELKRFVSADFLTRERSRIVSVYEDLAYKLATRYSNTGKTFLISDWEGDNVIYCGSVYSFLTNPEIENPFDRTQRVLFRSWCLNEYSRIYGGNARTPDEAMSGYRLWHSLRIEGIERGRRRAAEYGAKNVFVKSSLEFAAINLLRPINFPTVLERVALPLDFDSLSYSSYESINNGTLANDLDSLKSLLGTKKIGISEFGFSENSGFGSSAPDRLRQVTREVLRRLEVGDLEFAIAWQALEDGAAHEYGLYRPSLERGRLAGAFWSAISDHAAEFGKIALERSGGGCGGCDCGWAIGERIPEAQYLKVEIHDANWILRSEVSAVDVARTNERALSLRIPEILQSVFKETGLRFTVRDSRAPAVAYAVSPLVRCE